MANYWHELIDEALARRILGDAHFDYAVSCGVGYCEARRAGSWDANLAESYAAYNCAASVARARAAA